MTSARGAILIQAGKSETGMNIIVQLPSEHSKIRPAPGNQVYRYQHARTNVTLGTELKRGIGAENRLDDMGDKVALRLLLRKKGMK